jgi:hypothetical protein
MNRILIVSISLLILALTTPAAFADVIEPGMKNIDSYYIITNINDYPEYVFLAHGTPLPDIEIINSCKFGFYKLSTVSIYAIKKSEFNEEELKNIGDSALQNFFNNNSKLISSNIQLDGSYGEVGIDNPLESALIELEITSIKDTSMTIKKSKVIYSYSDGSIEEKAIENQSSLPEPSKNSNNWYFAIPVLALAAIGAVLVWKRFR